MSTLKTQNLIKSVGFGTEKMFIELNNLKVLTVPYSYTVRLKNATEKELKNYRIIANGIGINFKDIDEDISINGVIKDLYQENLR